MEALLVVGGIGVVVWAYFAFMRGFREGKESMRRKLEETKRD